MHDQATALKHLIDWAAVCAGIAAFFDAAPKIAGFLSMIWVGIQLWVFFSTKWKARNDA